MKVTNYTKPGPGKPAQAGIQSTGEQPNTFLSTLGNYAIESVKSFAQSEYDSRIGAKVNRVKARLDELDRGAKYVSKVLQDPSIAWADISDYFISWLAGKAGNQTSASLAQTAEYVLSDSFENELRGKGGFKVDSQQELRKISGGKYGDKQIFALYVENEDSVHIDEEIAKDEGMKYRALLHEALERASGRKDHSNNEKEHVDIELDVARALEYAAKNFTGVLRERAEKAKEAYYRTVHEGADAGDDLMSKVKSFLN